MISSSVWIIFLLEGRGASAFWMVPSALMMMNRGMNWMLKSLENFSCSASFITYCGQAGFSSAIILRHLS